MENRKITEMLNSLDGVKKAQAPDFFYTRLKARMERGSDLPVRNSAWYLQPVYVATVLVLIFALNAFVLLNNGKAESTTATTDDNETVQQTIAGDFSLADNNIIYDLNQDK